MGNGAVKEAELDSLWKKYDRNGDGLNLDEAIQLADEIRRREGLAKPLPNAQIKSIFDRLDADKSGKISQAEFKGLWSLLQKSREQKAKSGSQPANAPRSGGIQPASGRKPVLAPATRPGGGQSVPPKAGGSGALAKSASSASKPRPAASTAGAPRADADQAATKIQAVFKGNQARKESAQRKEAKDQQIAKNLHRGTKPKSKAKASVKATAKPKAAVRKGSRLGTTAEEVIKIPVSDDQSWAAQLREADWKMMSTAAPKLRSVDHFRRGALLTQTDAEVNLLRTTDIAQNPPAYDSDEDVQSQGSVESISGEITREWDPTVRDPRYTYGRDVAATFSEKWQPLNWTLKEWEDHLTKTGVYTRPAQEQRSTGPSPRSRSTPNLAPTRGLTQPRKAVVEREPRPIKGVSAIRPEIYASMISPRELDEAQVEGRELDGRASVNPRGSRRIQPSRQQGLDVGSIARSDTRQTASSFRELAVKNAVDNLRRDAKLTMVVEDDLTFATWHGSGELWSPYADDDADSVSLEISNRKWL